MKVVIIRFEGPCAICMKEDKSILDIKRINISKDAKEGDILNIDETITIIDGEEARGKYIHVNDIIIDIE